MYTYVYIYIYIYVYRHIYTCIYIYIYILHTHTHILTHVCVVPEAAPTASVDNDVCAPLRGATRTKDFPL